MLINRNPTPQDRAAMQAIEDLVSAKKLSDVKKICKQAVITEAAFTDFIVACDSGVLHPWTHHISYRDFPGSVIWTDEDAKRIGDINNGPLTETQTKAMRKWYQLLEERRYLVGHIFYWPDHSKWLFFYFDNRDVWQYKNHFKGGPHMHLINHLWPDRTAESVWKEFRDGNPDMKGAEHIRFDRPYEGPPQI
ncbi:hypothetical protein AB1286_07730 [Trinickia sp. NRRL B-1857]|uniref:hypothetical protein n=1 Tax=Trinickia sp. NRRL B-1857 TaxID=3162879 RepID=UPI003D2D7132